MMTKSKFSDDFRRDTLALSVRLALTLLASSALFLPALAGDALPTGGRVVSGAVDIGSAGGAMTVRQGSDRVIVNWQSFNIGQANSVNFAQPGVNAAILNRVTGNTPSSIAGALTGNGQVFLVNPNGIAITPTGTIKAGGGFVASTLDITDDNFMSGNMVFRGNGASGTVTNEGVVTIGRGGYVALMGGKVKNSGLIAVPYGRVGLGAGEEITLDLSGDGFMQVAVPSSLIDDGEALVENSGTVTAEGGVIVMKAATARAAARNAVNLSGVAEARSVSGRNGKITLGGGAGGKVKVSGRVSTRAKAAQPKTTRGGAIEITGLEINLDNAVIDASGYGAGGTVRIGGDWQGTGDIPHADILTVSAGTVISADAVSQGDGGTVVLWSDIRTDFAGKISATGATGTGGDAEVSGKAVLSYTGFANLTGAEDYGTLLLDPYNVTISDAADKTSDGFTGRGNDSVINVATLTRSLSGAHVTIFTGWGGTQAGNITIASDVTWSSAAVLTLSAANDIIFAANVTATGDRSGLALRFGSGNDYTLANGAAITLSGADASFTVNDSKYTLIHSLDDLDKIGTTGLAGNYALAGDLDASGKTYTTAVIGVDDNNVFTGTFAGLGHVISDLTINAPRQHYVGLFGYTESGSVIRDIGIKGGSITGKSDVGALVGLQVGGSIMQSYATGKVKGLYEYAGGLVGRQAGGTIAQSYSTGSVAGENYVGGLVGEANGTINKSYETGKVHGFRYVGGLVGAQQAGTIAQSYATGEVTSWRSNVGGLVGLSRGAITQSYATGSVTGRGGDVGGLVGYLNGGTITQSYFDTDTTGKNKSNGAGNRQSASGVVGLTTQEFQNAPYFYALASEDSWDFDTVWTLPGDGYYPQLYAFSDAASAKIDRRTRSYGDALSVALTSAGVAGTLPLSEVEFDPDALEGPPEQMTFAVAQSESDLSVVADPSLVSVTLCGAGARSMIVCR